MMVKKYVDGFAVTCENGDHNQRIIEKCRHHNNQHALVNDGIARKRDDQQSRDYGGTFATRVGAQDK